MTDLNASFFFFFWRGGRVGQGVQRSVFSHISYMKSRTSRTTKCKKKFVFLFKVFPTFSQMQSPFRGTRCRTRTRRVPAMLLGLPWMIFSKGEIAPEIHAILTIEKIIKTKKSNEKTVLNSKSFCRHKYLDKPCPPPARSPGWDNGLCSWGGRGQAPPPIPASLWVRWREYCSG